MKKWSATDIQQATSLLKDGKTYDDIGLVMGRTAKSVKVRLQKAGLTFKEFNPSKETRKCLHCSLEFVETLSSEKMFCNRSCAASFNNTLFIKRRKVYKKAIERTGEQPKVTLKYVNEQRVCLTDGCDNIVKGRHKYCSGSCHQQSRMDTRDKRIESGDSTLPSYAYKRHLIRKHGEKCMECGWSKVHPQTLKVPIELEHVDGNSDNNTVSNLKLLCPNCHSLTPTYKALNKGKGRYVRRQRFMNGQSF